MSRLLTAKQRRQLMVVLVISVVVSGGVLVYVIKHPRDTFRRIIDDEVAKGAQEVICEHGVCMNHQTNETYKMDTRDGVYLIYPDNNLDMRALSEMRRELKKKQPLSKQ